MVLGQILAVPQAYKKFFDDMKKLIMCCLSLFVILSLVSSDSTVNRQPGLYEKLLAQPTSVSLKELEDLGLVLPEVYETDRESAELVLREVLEGFRMGNYIPNYSYTEAQKLGACIVDLLYANDPELDAVRREYYASN